MDFTTDKIRNIALIGHSGEGKTSLAEAMLFNAKKTTRMGKVDDGSSIMDFDDEEIKRKISISLAIAAAPWRDYKINIIDAPGFFDFEGEMSAALEVADLAVIVTAAGGQVSVGTELAINDVSERGKSSMLFINQVEKDNNDYGKTYDAIDEAYPAKMAMIQYPLVEGGKVTGYIDIVKEKAFNIDNKEIEIPSNLKDKVENYHHELLELAAESDEALMEKYFAEEKLTADEIICALKKRQKEDGIILAMGGSATTNACVDFLMDSIVSYGKNPAEAKPKVAKDASGKDYIVKVSDEEPFVCQVFKSIADPFVGHLTMFKILSGSLKSGDTVYNANKEKQEKISAIYTMCGKKQDGVDILHAGDIGAVAKLLYTTTSDTLCSTSLNVKLDPIKFPEPVISLAVSSIVKGEDEKVIAGLNKLQEEDTTFSLEKNVETNQILLNGIGETQLDVLCKKLKNKYKVEAQLTNPRIAYRETITKVVEAHGKHKKQSGGHGQYGDVHIRFEPNPESNFEFGDEVVGGAVPKQYIPAVEKGLRECINKGVLAGYPVVNLKAVLYFGSYHDVDSSEMAFKIAASLAYKEGLAAAGPVLLEPIDKYTIIVPESYMGDILGDLNKRRGRILGMETSSGNKQIIMAEVPNAEMFKYATDLRSMTQGRGKFSKEFVRYEQMPMQSAQKVIEEAAKETE